MPKSERPGVLKSTGRKAPSNFLVEKLIQSQFEGSWLFASEDPLPEQIIIIIIIKLGYIFLK